MDRKVFVAIVDSEGIGQQSVPHVARMVKEAKVTNGNHARYLKGIAITGNGGHMEKDCPTRAKTKGKGKSAGSSDESEASVPENTLVGGFGLCSFGNSQCDEWKWNDCHKVTFTLDSGAAVFCSTQITWR